MPPDSEYHKEMVKEKLWTERRKFKTGLFRDGVMEKIERLRERIEDYCNENGYDKMGNEVERRDKKTGEIYYHQSHWEFVDGMHGNMYNDVTFYPHTNVLKKMNKLWKRYE
tara:strand:- start:203 stop:535 length:333 start_codon:yes stop_codon:yes gene_type:complete